MSTATKRRRAAKRELWQELRGRVVFVEGDDHLFTASAELPGDEPRMAVAGAGATEAAALEDLRRRVLGLDVLERPTGCHGAIRMMPTPTPGRPWLTLCPPCNRRAAEAGVLAELEGIHVCDPCAAAVDQYVRAIGAWKRRTDRNRRKHRQRLRDEARR